MSYTIHITKDNYPMERVNPSKKLIDLHFEIVELKNTLKDKQREFDIIIDTESTKF